MERNGFLQKSFLLPGQWRLLGRRPSVVGDLDWRWAAFCFSEGKHKHQKGKKKQSKQTKKVTGKKKENKQVVTRRGKSLSPNHRKAPASQRHVRKTCGSMARGEGDTKRFCLANPPGFFASWFFFLYHMMDISCILEWCFAFHLHIRFVGRKTYGVHFSKRLFEVSLVFVSFGFFCTCLNLKSAGFLGLSQRPERYRPSLVCLRLRPKSKNLQTLEQPYKTKRPEKFHKTRISRGKQLCSSWCSITTELPPCSQ